MEWMIRFLLSPLFWSLGIVRYEALKFVKRRRAPGDHQPATLVAEHLLDEIVMLAGLRCFKDGAFQKAAKFDALSEEEHDRIFNELETSAVALALMCLDAAPDLIGPEDYHFWDEVREKVPELFATRLAAAGVARQHVTMFRKLVTLRYEEYADMANEVDMIWKEREAYYRSAQPSFQDAIARIDAVTLGTVNHIRRGKMQKEDALPSVLRPWTTRLQERIGGFIKHL